MRCSAGSPAASAPTTIALSPASMRSIMITWPSVASPAAVKTSAMRCQSRRHASGGSRRAAAWAKPTPSAGALRPPAEPAQRRTCDPAGAESGRSRLLVHAVEEILVGLRILHLVEQELHRVDRAHLHEDAAQHPHLARACPCRPAALPCACRDLPTSSAGKMRLSATLRSSTISELPVPLNSSKITSSMRLPVSISAVAMIESEPPSSMLRAAPKKRFGRCSALASTPPVSTLPERRHDGVVGAAEAGDRIEQDHDVLLVLDQALGLFDHHFGDLDVARARARRRSRRSTSPFTLRCMSVTSSGRSSISSTIRNTSGWLSVIARGDVLEHHRLADARRRDDQRALALALRRDDVDHPRRLVLDRRIVRVERQLALGIERREIVEIDAVADHVGIVEIDRDQPGQREIALAVLGPADLAFDRVAGAQAELPDLVGRDVDVVGAGEIIGLGRCAGSRSRRAAPRSCRAP